METILSFLRNLEANNNKPWFDAHKNEYQEARAHFNTIVERLIKANFRKFQINLRMTILKLCQAAFRNHLSASLHH